MNKAVKVSVIIPVYNVELYLKQCLDSIINQTMTDIEIICVDDGSTDASLEILREYEAKDQRVKVLCQQNKYAGTARNNGMSVATGEYYVFLDSDDFFEPDLLECHYNQMKQNGTDISICGADRYNINTSEYEPANHYLNVPRIKSLVGNKEVFSPADVGDMIFSIASPAPWNKMFSAEFIKKHRLQFMGTQRANDSFFVLTALNLAEKITYIDKILVHYRVGMTTNLQANNSTSPFDFCHALIAVKERLEAEDVYKRVEKGFINNVLSQFDYNFSTLENKRPDAYLLLLEKYVYEYINTFEIADKDVSYFYDKTRFYRVEEKVASLEKLKQSAMVPVFEKMAPAYSDGIRPKISVVIPMYNVEEFLGQCIDSVLNQSLKEIEIICINDGSPDSSLSIVQSYATTDNRITVISQKNGGLSKARNTGIKSARGKYILFLDSDDLYTPDALSCLYEKAENNNLDLLLFGAETFYESEELKKRLKKHDDYYYRKSHLNFIETGADMLELQTQSNRFRSSACLQMFRLDLLKDNNIEFYSGIIHEDELFSPLVMVNAKKVMCIEDRFYLRRMRDDSIMTKSYTHRNFEGYFVAYVELMSAYISSGKKYTGLLQRAMTMYRTTTYRYKALSEEERGKILISYPEVYQFIYSSSNYDALLSQYNKGFFSFMKSKIKGGIQCYKDNGLKYTIYRFFEKIKKYFGK